MSVKLTLKNPQEFRALMERYQSAVGKSAGEAMREAVAGIARELMRRTQPFGVSRKEVLAAGTGAIARDTRQRYIGGSELYSMIARTKKDLANVVWAALRGGDVARARGIMRAAGVDLPIIPRLAESERRTNARQKGKPLAVLQTEQAFNKAIKEASKKVGYAKSSWALAAQRLGRKSGIPAWITSRGGPHRVEDRTKEANPSCYVESLVSYIQQACPSGEVSIAERQGLANFTKRMQSEIKAVEKRLSKN